jgi:MFS family permease
MAAAKVGPALGPLVATFLINAVGWRNMFLILGLGGIIWVIPWLLAVPPEKPREKSAGPAKGQAAEVSFWRVIASPVIWGTFIGTFCYQYFVYYSLTWLPLYFRDARNLNLAESAVFTAFSFSGMAIVATASGWIADRMITRGGNPVKVRKGFIFAGFLVASTEILGVLSDSETVALFFAVFSLSGLGLMTANYWALTQTMIPGAAVGRIVGIQNCAANLPGIVAPLLTGWLRDVTGSYVAPMMTILFFLMLGIASYLFLVREKYAPKGAPA